MNSKLPINMEKQPSTEQTLWKLSDKHSHSVSSWTEQPSSTIHRNASSALAQHPSDKLRDVYFCSSWPTLTKSLLPQKLLFLSQSVGGKVSPGSQSKSPCCSQSLVLQNLDLTATLFKQLLIWSHQSSLQNSDSTVCGVGFYTC